MVELGSFSGIISADASIELDGDVQVELNAALLSILVEETTVGLYRCEARFGNWEGDGYPYLDRQLLDFGRTMAVTMGADDGEGEVFRGRISALEAQYSAAMPPSLTVLAEDRLMDLRMTRRTRVFEDMTDEDMFGQIASDHGLQTEIDVSSGAAGLIAQINQSDLALIRDRARRMDAEVWVEGDTLHVQQRASRSAASDSFSLTLGLGLVEFEVAADLANQYTGVVVSGWDVAAKDALEYEATDSSLGSELNGDESGASVLRSAFGARAERIARQLPMSSTETQTLAEATFRQHARRFVVGHGAARGDARLRVGRQVTLDGLGGLFNGRYTITEVRHIFNRGNGGGYITEFTVERPGIERV